LKLRPAALPIIMLGGSPISVAVPPILDAKICVIKNGTGLSPSISVTAIVIGPTKSTVVTLSRKAERTAVIMKNKIIIIQGLPFDNLAALIAMYSNKPEIFTTDTKSIIPINIPTVLKSM